MDFKEVKIMKLEELLQVIDKNISLNINGQQYNKNIPEELLDFEVVKIGIELEKPTKMTLDELGYSFEVGV